MAAMVRPAVADAGDEARALLGSGQAAAALQRVDAALTQTPRDPSLRFLRGVVLMDLRRDTEALAAFRELAELYPELPDPWNNIATLYVRAGELPAALSALQHALRADPAHRLARANRAQVYLMLAVQGWEELAAQGLLDTASQGRLDAARRLVQLPQR